MKKTRAGSQQDTRATAELFYLAVSTEDQKEFDKAVSALWNRCSKDVLDTARLLCCSKMAHERAVGAYVLGGNTKECVRSGTTSIDQIPDIITSLSNMLDDEDPEVLDAVLVSLRMLTWGEHLNAEVRRSLVKSIPRVIGLENHSVAYVRRAVADTLGSLEDLAKSKRLHDSVESSLVKSTFDADADVRRQAVIVLTCTEKWSPEVRQALYSHLDDEDEGVRALVLDELAERGEPGTVDLLIREIRTHTVINETFLLEAAEKLSDRRLLPVLHELKEQGVVEWQSFLDDAIEASSGDKQT